MSKALERLNAEWRAARDELGRSNSASVLLLQETNDKEVPTCG